MILTEENYRQKINSLSKKDWAPLLELIPIIENTQGFGKLMNVNKDEDGTLHMPYWKAALSQFEDTAYKIQIVISFDWNSWDEGKKMMRDKKFNFDNIDLPTKCQLITAIIREDRFCEGTLIEAFESGLILKILKSIKKQM